MTDHLLRRRRNRVTIRQLPAIFAAVFLSGLTVAQHHGRGLLPELDGPTVQVRRVTSAPFLSEQERKNARVFHGVWTREDLDSTARRARAAFVDGRLSDESLSADAASAEDRAEAMIHRGEIRDALDLLDESSDSARSWRLRAEALEWLGEFNDADGALEPLIRDWQRGRFETADDLVEVARGLILRARLRGEPASYYHQINNLLADIHQRIDRLYWPAKLVEAELLLEKDNYEEAVAALHEVLALNQRAAHAWYLLGQVALHGFNFDAAESVALRLDHLNPQSPLASRLRAEASLKQRFGSIAEEHIEELLAWMPTNRHALALRAALYASRFDEAGMNGAFDGFDELSPGHPYAHYIAGMQLSFDRQYELASTVLNEAIRRQPNWAAPQIELGLMELQAGRDAAALRSLRRVSQLDPFNKRAAFSLHLLEDLVAYATHESDFFLIRHDPETADVVLAEEMGRLLDRMYREVTRSFQHTPERKTIIELMPNHSRFAVRITGMPDIHTIAASTGPVIAMETPREGPDHFGTYDWLRVLRHEFVHTVTLSQTENRIPHWLTEAAAVWQELAPRDYSTCVALAQAYHGGRLFNLDEINWAFVRPKRPGDRSLAYAQGHWMFDFYIERFGHSKMVDLLDAYRDGLTEAQAIPKVTGLDRDAFYEQFIDWAGLQVKRWGLDPSPTLRELVGDVARRESRFRELVAKQAERNAKIVNEHMLQLVALPRDVLQPERLDTAESLDLEAEVRSADEMPTPRFAWPELAPLRLPAGVLDLRDIDRLLQKHPMHPDLLQWRIELMVAAPRPQHLPDAAAATDAFVEYLMRYMEARPVDPMPFRKLADLYLGSDQPERAIPYLEELDRREQSTGAFAIELTRQYRRLDRFEIALDRAQRALVIEPFNANFRELAAAVAIQAEDYAEAREQLEALTIIEPDRSQHRKRLQALERLIDTQRDG